MRVRWFGQSAFLLTAGEQRVFIDPFGPMETLAARGIRFAYPPIGGVEADLLLVTHEHGDHNTVGEVGGSPRLLRSTAGTLESPLGRVTAVAAEHDPLAGTQRGPNTIFAFRCGGLAICHFGDFGQAALRPEQAEALGQVDLLFLPVGGGPTIGAEGAWEIVQRLHPAWVVPMHYRTPQIGFLETADAFVARFSDVRRLTAPEFETDELAPRGDGPAVVLPAAPGA